MARNQPFGSVLVVGGCGFLGHHIVSQLVESTFSVQVSVMDLQTTRNRLPSTQYYDGDISSKNDVHSVLKQVQPRVIIHTASPTAHAHDRDLYERVNINGTHNLLECAQELNTVRAFVFTSTASVVHDSVGDLIDADESFPVLYGSAQKDPYANSKAIAENLVLAMNRKHGDMLTTAIRPAGLFGDGDLELVTKLVETARSGKTKVQMGDGQNLFDFTYVGNAAQAHILAAKALLETSASPTLIPGNKRVDGEAFFVTNDDPYPFWDFTRAIGAAAGYPVKPEEIWVIPKSVGLLMGTISEWVVWIFSFGRKRAIMTRIGVNYSCMTRTYRIDKAKNRLGYLPATSMKEGIKRGAEWVLHNQKKTV